MNRYVSSFGITFFPYILGFVVYGYMETIHYSAMESKIAPKAMAIQIAYIPKPPVEPVTKEPEPIVEEPKIVPKPEPKPTKVLKKELAHKKVEPMKMPEVSQNLEVEKTAVKEEIKQEIVREDISTKPSKVDTQARQQQYFSELQHRIDTNKTYPRMARERNIAGHVCIEFTISPEGELITYAIIEGKQVFHKSVQDAITKSFPFPIKEPIFASNITISLTIEYSLL
ncbi:MAG: TonB family protein [Sulfurospirillaceae bacterium]|nr:TonB family protein [Sulfurospirillaceae bacterium]